MISDERNELFKGLAINVTVDYLVDWFDNTWPNLVEMVYSKLMKQACHDDAGVEVCRSCGNLWKYIGCPQHVLFACPNLQHVAFKSWTKFGPGTTANIPVLAQDWTDYIRKMSFNPFEMRTGIFLKIKLAYMGCLIEAYRDTELLKELHEHRYKTPMKSCGEAIMISYQARNQNRYNGYIAVAFDRARGSVVA